MMRSSDIAEHMAKYVRPQDQSAELTRFYREYKLWLDEGAPLGQLVFLRRNGLCLSLMSWGRSNCLHRYTRDGLDRELQQQFIDAGLDVSYPFNQMFGATSFRDESQSNTCHLNPRRIAWVNVHAK